MTRKYLTDLNITLEQAHVMVKALETFLLVSDRCIETRDAKDARISLMQAIWFAEGETENEEEGQ